jgi:HK97 family phage major capsid protein
MSVLTELGKLVQDELVQAVISVIVDTDEVFKLLPFRRVNGAGLTITWEDSLPEATFVAPDGTIPQSSGRTLRQLTETVKVIARDIDIPNYAKEVMGADIGAIIEGEIKAMGRLYKKAMYTGDESQDPNSFNGLLKRISDIEASGIDRTVDAGATEIAFSMLDELLTLMKMGADAIVMHPKAYIAFKDLLRRTTGGTTAYMIQQPNFGKPVLSYDGIPILQSEYIPVDTDSNGNKVTTILAVKFGEGEGVTGLYGGPSAGISYQEIGQAPDKDATRYRFKWYCGLTVMSPYAVARISNVKVG